MSAEATGYVWKHARGLSLATKQTLLAVADAVSDLHDNRFFMTPAKALAKTELGERTYRRAIAELVAAGWLEQLDEEGRKPGPGRPQVYRFIFKTPANLAPVTHANDDTNTCQRRHEHMPTTTERASFKDPKRIPREPLAPAAPKPRRPDELFDAVDEVCGVEPRELTKSARGASNRAVAELRAVGATPDDVRARAPRYRRQYPHAALTPPALSRHWASLADDVPGGARAAPACPDCGVGHGQHTPDCGRAHGER